MLAELEDFYMVDLVCDPELEPFYRRFELTLLTGMGSRRCARRACVSETQASRTAWLRGSNPRLCF